MPGKLATRKGAAKEHLAEQFLNQQGLSLVQRNFRCKVGELDLIMTDQTTLVFVEVKFRNKNTYGSALESITLSKRKKLENAAAYYLMTHANPMDFCRFDVVAISGPQDTIEWVKNAFGA